MNRNFDWIQVEGESMRPLLRSGDWIGVSWCEDGSLESFRPGDLVLGRHSDPVWLVHRLVATDASGRFLLKGDASYQSEQLGCDEIWGKVVAVRERAKPEGQRVFSFQATWLDRMIARLSRFRLRRTVFALGALRRLMLWSRAGGLST